MKKDTQKKVRLNPVAVFIIGLFVVIFAYVNYMMIVVGEIGLVFVLYADVIMGGIMVSILVMPVILRKKERRHTEQMKQHGAKVVLATVLSMEETGYRVNDDPQVHFQLRFLWNEQMIERHTKLLTDRYSHMIVGDKIMLLYDPVTEEFKWANNEDVYFEEPNYVVCCINDIVETGYSAASSHLIILHATSEVGESFQVPVIEWKEYPYHREEWLQLKVSGPQSIIVVQKNMQKAFPPEDKRVPVQAVVVASNEPGWHVFDKRVVCYQISLTSLSSIVLPVSGLVPDFVSMVPGTPIDATISEAYYNKIKRMENRPQGKATVLSIEITSKESMMRPIIKAKIAIDGKNDIFDLEEAIDLYFGLQEGDALWVVYEITTKEAMILRYLGVE